MTTKYERTSPDYPTKGPSDNETWAEYFKRVKTKGEPEPIEEPGDDDEEASRLTVEPHEVTIDEVPNPLQTYAKLADKLKITYKLCHSQSFIEGTVFKSGQKAGEMRPDRTIDHYWINGHKEGKGIFSVSYEAEGKKVTAYNRNINRILRVVPDREMKAWLKNE